MAINLLVVDDETVMRELVATHLRGRGFEVATAPDGRAALEILAVRRTDIVVLDLEMPLLDGNEVLEVLRRQYPLVRTVVLTGKTSIDHALGCLHAGAFAFVAKPLTDMAPLDRAVDLAAQVLAAWHAQLAALKDLRRQGVKP